MIPHQAATTQSKRHEKRRDADAEAKERKMGREGTSEAGRYAGRSVCVAGNVHACGIAGWRVYVAAEQAPTLVDTQEGRWRPKAVGDSSRRHCNKFDHM